MAVNEKTQERPAQSSAELLEGLIPGLSSAALAQINKTAESRETVRFMFHPWVPIPNVTLAGFTFGVQHVVLQRMCLIPIRTWNSPVIQPRTGGFTVGALGLEGNSFPSGSVGSRIDHRLQFPAESVEMLLTAYGVDGPSNIGMVELKSLVAEKDQDKVESVLIFRSVMETAFDDTQTRGVDICIEELPAFLKNEAVKLLRLASDAGVDVGGQNYKLSKAARRKGELMILDLQTSVAGATRRATDANTGFLSITKGEMLAASRGVKDKKAMPDKLDEWLLQQFPSFSLDTDVERAARANRSLTDAIREGGHKDFDLRELMEMQQKMFEQLTLQNTALAKAQEELSKANATNAQLAAKLSSKAA